MSYLILRRGKAESFVVNGPALITVLGVKGGVVKVGITADKEVSVMRTELIDRDAKNEGTERFT